MTNCIRAQAVTATMLLAACAFSACRPSSSADSTGPLEQPAVAPAPVATDIEPQSETTPGRPDGSPIRPAFFDVASQLGIDFTFFNDEVPGRYFLPEVMGGGAAWLDYDLDGRIDLYLANGAPLEDPVPDQPLPVDRFFRNLGDRFQDVTLPFTAMPGGYGQGCSVGDFDADGFPDLYVANFGPNLLFRNNGDGTFQDVTDSAGVGDPSWSTSPAWVDLNDDQLVDLFVTNYLQVNRSNRKVCEYDGRPGYCGPGSYEAAPDRVYLNAGNGSFVESSDQLGFNAPEGKGLAIAVADFDGDARPEVYIANDMAPNFLYRRDASSTAIRYVEVAMSAGCAVSDEGANEASMGVACADFDGDGGVDIYLTHYYSHKNTLYRNLGNLLFVDDSRRTRVAATSFETLGFGTVAFDYDRDGWRDLFVANGHVLGPLHKPNEMRAQLLRNDGSGRFDDISSSAGPYFQELCLGRGAAGTDYDDDGDLDLLVTHLHRPVALLRNDTPNANHFIGFDLRTLNRVPPMGARITVIAGTRQWTIPVVGSGSYLCSGDPRLLVGIGDWSGDVEVDVTWPSGEVNHYAALAIDRYWRVTENDRAESVGEPRQWIPAERR